MELCVCVVDFFVVGGCWIKGGMGYVVVIDELFEFVGF